MSVPVAAASAKTRRIATTNSPATIKPGAVRVLGLSDMIPRRWSRFAPGIEGEQALARLRRDFSGLIFTPRPHAEVRNLQRVGGLPNLLAGLVALLALAMTTHTLVTSVRRRRRDLAVLKTLGFVRGQVAATVAWQATTFAVVALVLGLPLGLAAGRWAWQLTANALGVDSGPVVPGPAILAVVVGTLAAANLVAAGPGRAASRLRPAAALRSE